jgi:hypothetical protein
MVGQREEMLLQLIEAHPCVHGDTVVNHVQIRLLEIDDLLTMSISNVSVAYVPLPRHSPVEHRGAGRNFMNLQGDVLPQSIQRLTQAVSRDTSANRVKIGDQTVHLATDLLGIDTAARSHAFSH